MKAEELKNFLQERSVACEEKRINYAVQLHCSDGEIFTVYDSGKVVVGGKRTPLSDLVEGVTTGAGKGKAYRSYTNSGCVTLWHRFYRNIELTQRKSGIVIDVIVFVTVAVEPFWVSILSAIAVLTINYLSPQVDFPDNNVRLPML